MSGIWYRVDREGQAIVVDKVVDSINVVVGMDVIDDWVA